MAILSQNKECPFRLEALVFSINTSVERIMNMQAYCSEIYDDCGMKVAGGGVAMPIKIVANFATIFLIFALTIFPSVATADYDLNMPRGITSISREVYDLHMLALWMVTSISAVVFGLMVWSIINHRKSKGPEAEYFHHNTIWEVVRTVIPILILLLFAAPATRTLIEMKDTEISIMVTGNQWRWHYEYLNEGFGFSGSELDYLLQIGH